MLTNLNHFAIYMYIKSLYCETNTVLYVDYISVKAERKKDVTKKI